MRRRRDPIDELRDSSDETLVGLMARRDEGAIRELFRRYAPFLVAMAERMGFGPESLRLTQDTFVRLWDDARRFDPVKMTARTWIVTTAHRRAVTRLEAVGSSRATPAAEVSADPLQAAEKAAGEDEAYVSEALGQLDPLARQLLELAYFGGLDHHRLVMLSDRSPATVQTAMRRALASLHDAVRSRKR